MRTRRSQGKESEPLEAFKPDYTWCLLCTGTDATGYYNNGSLRRHYAERHRLEDVPRSVHDTLTSLLHELERRTAVDEPRDEAEAAPRSQQREVGARTADGGPRGDARSTTTTSEVPNETLKRPTSDFRISAILGETPKIMEKDRNEGNARAEEGNLMIDLVADNG